jgi:EPS-associated MarR family transcriptional regulator
MELSRKDFEILDALDREEITTQRQLSEHAGVSLGQVNYVLKSLLEKGLVKLGNFRKSQRKIQYAYLLTPKGIEAKSTLASGFIMSKLNEYHTLRKRLAERLAGIEKRGKSRIVFVGPQMVKDFVESVIKEKRLKLELVGHCFDWHGLKDQASKSYDMALLFNGITKEMKKIEEIDKDKLLPLW